MDGKYHVLNFTPNDTANDILKGIMKKISLVNANGNFFFKIYFHGNIKKFHGNIKKFPMVL